MATEAELLLRQQDEYTFPTVGEMTTSSSSILHSNKKQWENEPILFVVARDVRSIFKNMVKCELKEVYANNSEFRTWFKKIFTFCLIPIDKVKETFKMLKEEILTDPFMQSVFLRSVVKSLAVDRIVDSVAVLAVVPERVVVLGEILGLIGPIFHDEVKIEKCGKVCKKRGFKRHRFYCANDVANDADDENN